MVDEHQNRWLKQLRKFKIIFLANATAAEKYEVNRSTLHKKLVNTKTSANRKFKSNAYTSR